MSYPLLAIAGAVTQRQFFSLLALLALLTSFLLPRLWNRRVVPWLVWLGLVAGLLLLSSYGFAGVLLELVPVLIQVALAYWFGRTLTTPRPLIARFIVAIEGEGRLTQPGVAKYARQLTWFWTVFLGAQALLLGIVLTCTAHGGLLAGFGVSPMLPISDRWISAWLHVGDYLLLGAVFGLEYLYRRWRLRHLSHLGLHAIMGRLAAHWPQLMRGDGVMPS